MGWGFETQTAKEHARLRPLINNARWIGLSLLIVVSWRKWLFAGLTGWESKPRLVSSHSLLECLYVCFCQFQKRNLDVGQLDFHCILFRSTSVFISFTSPTGFTQGTCNLSSKALSVCVCVCECNGGDHLLLKDSPMHSCWKMKIQVQMLLSFLCLSAEAVCVCVCHCAHVKGELWDCCLHGCYWEACCCVMEMRQLLFTSAPVSASAVSRMLFFFPWINNADIYCAFVCFLFPGCDLPFRSLLHVVNVCSGEGFYIC